MLACDYGARGVIFWIGGFKVREGGSTQVPKPYTHYTLTPQTPTRKALDTTTLP